jgi:hypothetical protein
MAFVDEDRVSAAFPCEDAPLPRTHDQQTQLRSSSRQGIAAIGLGMETPPRSTMTCYVQICAREKAVRDSSILALSDLMLS